MDFKMDLGVSERDLDNMEKMADLLDKIRALATDANITIIAQTVGSNDLMGDAHILLHVPRDHSCIYSMMVKSKRHGIPADTVEQREYKEGMLTFRIKTEIPMISQLSGIENTYEPGQSITDEIAAKPGDQWVAESCESLVGRGIAGHCKECGSEIPLIEHFFHLDAVKRMVTPVGKGSEVEVELPSGVKVVLHTPSHERVTQLISGFGHDFEPCADGDVIILGGRDYRVTRPHHDRIPDDLEYMYPHRLERLNFPGMGGVWPMGDSAAPTPERAAAKRRQSDVHVNGRPKKSWQR